MSTSELQAALQDPSKQVAASDAMWDRLKQTEPNRVLRETIVLCLVVDALAGILESSETPERDLAIFEDSLASAFRSARTTMGIEAA